MAKLVYRDGLLFKHTFNHRVPPETVPTDGITIGKLGYNRGAFFNKKSGIVPYRFNPAADHDDIEVLELEASDLPENFWEIIKTYLPEFKISGEVERNIIMRRYVLGEFTVDTPEEDSQWIKDMYENDRERVQEALDYSTIDLYTEAVRAKRGLEIDIAEANSNLKKQRSEE